MVTITAPLFEGLKRNNVFPSEGDDFILNTINRYKKFLLLVQKNPNKRIAPTKSIDAVWHMHMLYPVHYYHDCMNVFGYILDHNPGFGGQDDEEYSKLKATFENTAQLWESIFNEPYCESEYELKICDGGGGDTGDAPGGDGRNDIRTLQIGLALY